MTGGGLVALNTSSSSSDTLHNSETSHAGKTVGGGGQRANQISKSEPGLMAALMEFALLVELTIIRQLKLKWVCECLAPFCRGSHMQILV